MTEQERVFRASISGNVASGAQPEATARELIQRRVDRLSDEVDRLTALHNGLPPSFDRTPACRALAALLRGGEAR